MNKYLFHVGNLTALIFAKIFGLFFSYQVRQKMCLFWNWVFSYSNAKYFREFGEGASIARNVVIMNPRYISIGDGSTIGEQTVITAWDRLQDQYFTPEITIGKNTSIGADCHLSAIQKIVLGDGVLLGKKITITDNSHGACTPDQLAIPPSKRCIVSKGPVVIGDHVWIGDKATILPGVHIGRGAIIGANAVVTCDIPEGCVAAGIPAKVVKNMLNSSKGLS